MKQLNQEMFKKIGNNILTTARPLEIAKFKYLFLGGEKQEIETELLKYQNEDGGFGNGLEIDTVTPESSALCASEAIKLAEDYHLDMKAEWVKKLLFWLETSASNSPSFWDLVPKSLENYPHMPYLKYRPDIVFTPHVCAIFVPALVLYGTPSQVSLGEEILERCENFIKTNQPSWHLEIMFLQRMYLSLKVAKYSFDEQLFLAYIKEKVAEMMGTDESKWLKFVALPLDLVQSPKMPWFYGYEMAVEKNIDYLIDTLREDGTWKYKDSWDTSTAPLCRIASNWSGYHAVKKLYLLRNFGAIL